MAAPTEPRDEDIEAGRLVVEELERLAQHPREEARRLAEVADDGESGLTPFIELARVAARVIPLVALVIGLGLAIYHLA